jgi:type I restriction enzyme M protein
LQILVFNSMAPSNFQSLANFIWSVADLLRGPYRPPQYERVMLPMTVLRRFDCVLEHSKAQILAKHQAMVAKNETLKPENRLTDFDPTLNKLAKDIDGRELGFHNHSPLNFEKLKGDPDNVGRHLQDYINGFSKNIRDIFDKFEFDKEIEKMEDSNRLYLVVSKFAEIDLHPELVDNITMGLVFEDLIRRFNESANETAGDHFTPREVIRLMVNLLMEPDGELLTNGSPIVTICDPACGTGGMLAEAQNWIREHNENAIVQVFGQDYNPRSFAVAASDLLIKGHKNSRITKGNTLTEPPFPDIDGFDYMLANPPFGVDWKAEQKQIAGKKGEVAKFCGYEGKLPRVNDGALLFLLYMLSKRQDYAPSPDPQKNKRGTRIAVVFNGSPLFTGGAGSGESDIRRWVIENDWLEAIIALPEQMFYNTGIGTFIWVVTNRKTKKRKGKIQLIDCRERYRPMPRSLGDKRRYIDQEIIDSLSREHGACTESDTSKFFANSHFGYRRITVERPLRLRFQITDEAKEMFLNSCPELLDAIEAIEENIGTEPLMDWNHVWAKIQHIVKGCDIGWSSGPYGAQQKKFFRECFTNTDPKAAPVVAKVSNFPELNTAILFPGQNLPKVISADDLLTICGYFPETKGKKGKALEYEADPKLRDNENVPLNEDIVSFFLREVRPYVADAWINDDPKQRDEKDGGIGKVGYEINFNREFFRYEEPRSLKEIDKELASVEKRILKMLQEVTE